MYEQRKMLKTLIIKQYLQVHYFSHCASTLVTTKSVSWLRTLVSVVWTFWWRRKLPTVVNPLSHESHLFGFSPVWDFMCVILADKWANLFLHVSHSCDLSIVCDFMWMTLCVISVNRLSQTSHSNGLSLEWTLMWTFRLDCWLKVLWHTSHRNGFSPVCDRMWLVKSAICRNRFWHISHSIIFFGFADVLNCFFHSFLGSFMFKLPASVLGFTLHWEWCSNSIFSEPKICLHRSQINAVMTMLVLLTWLVASSQSLPSLSGSILNVWPSLLEG